MKYNGYSNKPTWLVSLWLTNDEEFYNSLLAVLQDTERSDWAAVIQSIVEDNIPVDDDLYSGLYSDLLNWALAFVDWEEVASVFAEDITFKGDDGDDV